MDQRGGACAAFLLAAGTGQLGTGLAFCARHVAAARNVAFYALASVIGQLFVYFTITEFDPLVLSTVTTTRKIFSTVYSAARSPAGHDARAVGRVRRGVRRDRVGDAGEVPQGARREEAGREEERVEDAERSLLTLGV